MSCPECEGYLERALVEVRRVNEFVRRVKTSGNVQAKFAPVVLRKLALDAAGVLEGREQKPGMDPARLAEIKARYKGTGK